MRARRLRATSMIDMAELQQLTRAFRGNVLIVGHLDASQRDEIVQAVKAQRGLAVIHAQRHSKIVLPTHDKVIVVLDNVCDLSTEDQERLLKWISRHQGRIVSFASHSPYALVCAGTFVERLYYQLNTVCLVLDEE